MRLEGSAELLGHPVVVYGIRRSAGEAVKALNAGSEMPATLPPQACELLLKTGFFANFPML